MPIVIKSSLGKLVKTISASEPSRTPKVEPGSAFTSIPASASKPVNDDDSVVSGPPSIGSASMTGVTQAKVAAPPSGYPHPSVPPQTLGDVKRHLEQLSATNAGENFALLVSAINAVTSKFPGTTADDHNCDPALLRTKLASVPCSEKDKPYWSSIRSRLRRALVIAGVEVMEGKRKRKLEPVWEALLAKLPKNGWAPSLSRFFGFCTVNNYDPEQVCDALVHRFLLAMQATSLSGRPFDVYRGTIRGWNYAAQHVEGWPQIQLMLPAITKKRSTLYPEEFTPAFQAALKAYLEYLSDPPEDDDNAPFKPLAHTTLKTRSFLIRQIASALIAQGIPKERINDLADLLSKEKLDLLCTWLKDKRGTLVTSMNATVLQTYLNLARFQVNDPELVKRISRRLKVKVYSKFPRKGMTQKNRQRLAQLKDPDVVRTYMLLPFSLRQKAKNCAANPRRAALLMRAAVAIEFEMMCPIRLGNFASLIFNKHLLPYSMANKRTGMRLHIPGSEVKNGEDIDLELPEQLVRLIEEYLLNYRKILIDPQFQLSSPVYLFPRPDGKQKSGKVLAENLCGTIQNELGIRFNFHLFRHIGCYLYLQRCPHDYETMRRVLAHRSLETTVRFYAEMEKEDAFKNFDKIMAHLREDLNFGFVKPPKQAAFPDAAIKPPKPTKLKTPTKPSKPQKFSKYMDKGELDGL